MKHDHPRDTSTALARATPPILGLALLVSACGTYGYDVESILNDPGYHTVTARTAWLPPMPNVGPAAGELDSARVTVADAEGADVTATQWTYAGDTLVVAQQTFSVFEDDETSVEFEVDYRAYVPMAPDPDGVAVTRIENFEEEAGDYVYDGRRETTRAGGSVTEARDFSRGGDGSFAEVSRWRYRRSAAGRVTTEIVTAEVEVDGEPVQTYDSTNYYYDDAGVVSRWAQYKADPEDGGILRWDTGRVSITASDYTHTALREDDDSGFEEYTLRFTGPDAGFEIDGETYARIDDGSDDRVRVYRYEDGLGFVGTYAYYYRSPVSDAADLPPLTAEITAVNPIAPGDPITLAGLPAGATYVITDVQGRYVDGGTPGVGAAVSWPTVAPGIYLLTVRAPGYAPLTRRFVAE